MTFDAAADDRATVLQHAERADMVVVSLLAGSV